MRIVFTQFIFSILVGLMGLPKWCSAENINVAVAANFQPTLARLKLHFEQISEHNITIISGSTGKLYAQILNGAPFDLFFSADSERPLLLEQQSIGLNNSRFTYAVGQLVVWSLDEALIKQSSELFASNQINRVAIANPKLAPYGEAAMEYIQRLELDGLKEKLVMGENISQAFHLTASGSAEIGFVSLSQVKMLELSEKGHYWVIPDMMYQSILQQAIVLNDKPASQLFAEFVRSVDAQKIIMDSGYKLPNGRDN